MAPLPDAFAEFAERTFPGSLTEPIRKRERRKK